MTTTTVTRLVAHLEGLAREDAHALPALANAPEMLNCGAFNNLEYPWRAAAFREVQKRLARIAASLDFETLMDVAGGELDGRAVARHVHEALRAQRVHPEDPTPPPRWEVLDPKLREDLTTVAHRFLSFQTLEHRHRDSLDFQEVGCGSLRDALVYAYFMGLNAHAAV